MEDYNNEYEEDNEFDEYEEDNDFDEYICNPINSCLDDAIGFDC